MRASGLLSVLLLLLLLSVGTFGTHPDPQSWRETDAITKESPSGAFIPDDCIGIVDCQDPGHSVAPPAVPSVEDRQLYDSLMQAGRALARENRITDIRLLKKELGFDQCELDLPEHHAGLASAADLYRQASASVVVVAGLYKCPKCGNMHASLATGFVISATGAIVTNYHVVDSDNKESLFVRTGNGEYLPVTRVLAANRRDDLAILKVEANDLAPLPLAASRQAAPVGSTVSVISHPARHFYSFTEGVVSRYMTIPTKYGKTECLAITADYAKGSSGAPVLNDQGEVVGIVKSTESIYYDEAKGIQRNLQMVFKTCIPVSNLRKLIKS